LAQLGAGLAHETKNPLGLARGLAQSIAEAGDAGAESRRQARQIVDEADRIVGQINAFLALARPAEPVREDVALDHVFGGLQALVQAEAAQAGVSLRAAANGLVVRADPALLRRALLNLLINALRACERGGEIALEAGWRAGSVAVCVRDNGRGIAPEDLPRVREPYFTRFPGGTGLGLAMVEQVTAAHGWRLQIESEPGAGTRVTLEGMAPAESPG
jgi:two-component system sensor histidine kinase HydH